ncbi:radical SAM protein [Sulfurovum sp.]|uniref:B12-binding domain-containing radical SAM protein n=1 Tax=Sulfurovum sp. TaxID=1969726 RepID=UPI003561870A
MKLGFIAMSGVRALNEELTELGLTLPGFVERGKVIASLPSLGLLTLAALTPKEIEVQYCEVEKFNDLDEVPEQFDAVAISSFTAQIKEAYCLADKYREKGTKVIMGGLHVNAMPEEASIHADAIVLGEGELAWPTLTRDLQNNCLQSVYDMRGENFDLSNAPIPRFDLLDINKYNRLTVQTQRGCPHNCEFCASSILLTPHFKVKPVEKVIEEIQYIKKLWPKPFIEFADDNTFANKTHAKKLLRALTKEDIRWFTETDISIAEDDELLMLLRESGCAQVLIGLESPSKKSLDGLELHSNWKARQIEKNLDAIKKIQSYGITVNGCFILGLDGTDVNSFQEVLDFVQESTMYEVQITIQTPFPGTPLYDRLKSNARLLDERAWETCTLFDVNFKPDSMSVKELQNHFKWLINELYNEERTMLRRQKFRSNLRKLKHSNINRLSNKVVEPIKNPRAAF